MSVRVASPGELVFATAIVAVGAYAMIASRSIPEPVSAGSVGPRAVPLLVGLLMVVVGSIIAIGVLRGRTGQAEEGEDVDTAARTDWTTVGALVGFVALHIVLIRPLGWPVAAALLFAGAAWSLGARPVWRAGVVGVVLALILQATFAGWLGVSLPPGPLLEGVSIFHG